MEISSKEQTPDVDYTGFDHRNRPNTGFAVAWAYKNHPNARPKLGQDAAQAVGGHTPHAPRMGGLHSLE